MGLNSDPSVPKEDSLPFRFLPREVECAIATLELLEQSGRYDAFKDLHQMIVDYFQQAPSAGDEPTRRAELLGFAKQAVGTMH